MIFLHEGLPRSGKSYEAVLHHILPALQAGRQVYVRLNGVCEETANIAAHLGMDEAAVKALLVPMGKQEVHDWLVCDANDDGSMVFPHIPKDALVVVDEAQDYWPTGRHNLPDRVATFFSSHGHANLNILLMSQDFKDMHRLIGRRIQKRNQYTKLDALGADQRYSVRFLVRTSADKFENMGTEARKYDPVVWGCYHGVQPGVEDNAVYKSNTRTIWKTAKWPAIACVLAVGVGVWVLFHFFSGGGTKEPVKVAAAQPATPSGVYQRPVQAPAPVAIPVIAKESADEVKQRERSKLPTGVRYVLDLADRSRPRYVGFIGAHDLIEFRASGQGQLLDQFNDVQLAALGWTLERTAYGARIFAQDTEIILTPWPVDMLGVQSMQTTNNIRASGPIVTQRSERQPGADASGVAVHGSASKSGDRPSSGAFRG